MPKVTQNSNIKFWLIPVLCVINQFPHEYSVGSKNQWKTYISRLYFPIFESVIGMELSYFTNKLAKMIIAKTPV